MSNRKVAFTLLALLLVQVAVPFIPADAASGRKNHDFKVFFLILLSLLFLVMCMFFLFHMPLIIDHDFRP